MVAPTLPLNLLPLLGQSLNNGLAESETGLKDQGDRASALLGTGFSLGPC